MFRRSLFPILLAVSLLGCKGGREREAVGTWVSSQGVKIIVAEDKTYHSETPRLKSEGTWQMDGADVVFTPKTLNGKSMAEVKSRLQAYAQRAPAARRPLLDKIIHDAELPNVFLLSADGKSMATDKAKDKNEGGGTRLTKQASA